MALFEALLPVWYLLLACLGTALSSIIVDVRVTKGEVGAVSDTTFTFAAVVLALSLMGLAGSVWATVLACKRPKDSSPHITTTTDCALVMTDVGALALGALVLALSALIVKVGAPTVAASSVTFSIIVLSLSSASVLISIAKLITKCMKLCEPHVEVH